MEKMQIYSKNSSHFFLQFQPYGFRVTPFICLNLAAPIFSLLRPCSLEQSSLDWNRIEIWNWISRDRREADDRLTRVPVSQQASTGGIIYCLVLTDIECRLLPWLGFALLEYTLSVKVLLTLCYILRSINCSRSWLVWSVWRFSTNVEWNLGSKGKA